MSIQKQYPNILNLGAGTNIIDNAHNVDIHDLDGIDETHDLNEYPWPWPDDSFSRVLAKHVLEHVDEPMRAIGEITRVLERNGTFVWWYPIGHTRFEDPTHTHYWNFNTSEAITGERRHEHQFHSGLELKHRTVDWRVNSLLLREYVRLKIWKDGYGPWLSQIPGLHGKVVAHYRKL